MTDRLLRDRSFILIDFDGPICSVFAGYPAEVVAQELIELVHDLSSGTDLSGLTDPHDVLRGASASTPSLLADVEQALQRSELAAVATATPTPGAVDVLHACRRTGRPVAIVSNNCTAAIAAYLNRFELVQFVDHIEGRYPLDVALMKPSPYLLHSAMNTLGAAAEKTAFIGDTQTDIEAAKSARVLSVGYANKPGKRERLAAGGASVVVESMAALVTPFSTPARHRAS